MKKRRIIVLVAVGLVICAACLWQLENIKAGVNYFKYSSDELSEKLSEGDRKIDETMEKLPEVSIRPLTPDEREQLRSGALSADDALSIMLETPSSDLPPSDLPESSAAPAPVPETTPDTEKSEQKEKYARISELIARVYVMRDSYVAQLESIKDTAISEYTSLDDIDRTDAKKRELALRCIDEATALEAACDAEMNSIVSELTTLLGEVGGDTSIASDIKAAYAEEKALKKAYYMDLYLN